MGSAGVDRLGSALFERLGRLHDRAGGVNDIVDEDAGLAVYIADDLHHLALVRDLMRAAFVDDREIGVVDLLRELPRAHNAADVGRDDGHKVMLDLLRKDAVEI